MKTCYISGFKNLTATYPGFLGDWYTGLGNQILAPE